MTDSDDRNRLLALASGPGGLICAFDFVDGQAQRLGWPELRGSHAPARPAFRWVHLKTADARMQAWLEQADLPEGVSAFLTRRDTRPRVHVNEHGVYGLLIDLKMTVEGSEEEKGVLHFYLDDSRLYTVRTQPLRSTDRLRRQIEEGRAFDCSIDLLAGLLQCLADGLTERLERLADDVDEIEVHVLSDRRKEDRGAISAVRRELAELRRHVHPERNVFARLCALEHAWADDDALEHLSHVVESLNSLAGNIDALAERAKLLQEEIASQMSEEMNRSLVILSVLTALLLPATLVSGIFGMNVAGLPGLKDESSFWWVLGLMAFLGMATLLFMRKLRLW
jgi:zinc transporter